MSELFTIGHSHHGEEEFLALLARHGVGAVADVRSSPYSRFVPHFNREALRAFLTAAGVRYVYLGEELGARRGERECYDGDKARYSLIAKAPLFQAGLARVRKGAESYRIALLCAEKDPLTCHRSILICRHLRHDLAIAHILADGELEAHAELEARLLALVGLAEPELFRSREQQLEDAYDRQGERLAYVAGSHESEEP